MAEVFLHGGAGARPIDFSYSDYKYTNPIDIPISGGMAVKNNGFSSTPTTWGTIVSINLRSPLKAFVALTYSPSTGGHQGVVITQLGKEQDYTVGGRTPESTCRFRVILEGNSLKFQITGGGSQDNHISLMIVSYDI